MIIVNTRVMKATFSNIFDWSTRVYRILNTLDFSFFFKNLFISKSD